MSVPTTGGLVGVLKQKMLDTKEEVEKVKSNMQDLTREIQVQDELYSFINFSIFQIEVERREVALSEVTHLEEKLMDLEEQLAKKKDMAKEAIDLTSNLGKESEESLRVARVLRNKNNVEDEQVAALEKQLE